MPSPPTASVRFAARAFGSEAEDLDADFTGSRPGLVTQLLANCVRSGGQALSETELWNHSVAWRTQALLEIGCATAGMRLRAAVRCAAAECRETIEIDLVLSEFRQTCEERSFRFSPVPGTEFTVRLPSGADQLRYGESLETDRLPLTRELLGDAGQQFLPEWLPALEAELSQHDPLTDLQLHAACPWCGHENVLDFDLEEFLLRELARRQRTVLDAVHRLALVYHWSERDILALPAQRRTYYLERLDREGLP